MNYANTTKTSRLRQQQACNQHERLSDNDALLGNGSAQANPAPDLASNPRTFQQ